MGCRGGCRLAVVARACRGEQRFSSEKSCHRVLHCTGREHDNLVVLAESDSIDSPDKLESSSEYEISLVSAKHERADVSTTLSWCLWSEQAANALDRMIGRIRCALMLLSYGSVSFLEVDVIAHTSLI